MTVEISKILTVRIGTELERSLEAEARRRRTSKSGLVREILGSALGVEGGESELAREARRQSLLVRGLTSETEVLDLVQELGDPRGWE